MKLENFTHDYKTLSGRMVTMCFFFLMFLTFGRNANAQSCPLACNNLVQVSLDDDCRVEVTPDMMLEGQGTDPSCTYQVTVLGANGLPIAGTPFVTGNHIGMTLTVKVSLGLNSCWGTIKVEDKLAPVINCPDDLTISCYDNRTFPLPTATDNCGGNPTVKLISDILDDQGCDDDWSAVRTLTYQATDKSGNKSALCIRQIFYYRVDFEELDFPLNRDDVEAPALECDNIPAWDTNNNGYPDYQETGVPTIDDYPIYPNKSLCELNATFSDQKLEICASSFKVLRKWTVLDWCTGRLAEDFQIIKVVDREGPIVTCAPDQIGGFSIFSDPYDCQADWEVPAPVVIYDCSSTTYSVDYLLADANGNPPVNGVYINDNVVLVNGKFIIRDLPVGRTWVRYTVKDQCNNFTYCFTEVDVVDNVPPVAVCDEFTVVTLTTGGVAQIFAETFDDGSHDNCTDVSFDARRMTAGCSASTVNYTKAVNFCCDDVGKDIMVQMRVYDDGNGSGIFGDEINIYEDTNASGILGDVVQGIADKIVGKRPDNFNTCMVTVRVQDKIDPKIVCPANITINCDKDYKDTNITGKPVATDNCGTPTVTNTDSGSLNQCGIGNIVRTWRATDAGGRFATCNQTISVRNEKPFTGTDINWNPVSNKTLTGCIDIDTDPSKTGKPSWTSDQCDLIASTYSDQVFTIVDSACFKILRTWTVIDWCTFDQNNPYQGGIWQYTQVIKLNNTVKPVFAACADVTVCAYGENCNGFVDLKATATDDCTPEEKLVWKYAIDLNNDGTINTTGTTNNASAIYAVGKHKITWTVEDKCGNLSTCSYLFTVNDCKKPTPYCLSEITTVIMPSSGSIDIWASDFDKGSFDNCPGTLKISFSANVNDTKRTFNCDNLGINNLQMWVTDVAGNKEFCSVKINIQANPGACGTTTGNITVISGNVGTEQGRKVNNVSVSLTSTETMIVKSNTDGQFAFQGMTPNTEYNLTADHNDKYDNGLSTLDLVMIQRHILGSQKLDSPFKLIAADANADTKISASDLVELRKIILGVKEKLDNNKSWRFLDAAQTFADPSKPWPFVETVKVNFQGTSIQNTNLKGVKIGDVNESAAVNLNGVVAEPRSNKTLSLELGQQVYEQGSRIIVPVYAGKDANVSGMQFTLNYNEAGLKFVGMVPGVIDMDESNFHAVNGKIAASWSNNGTLEIAKNDELFALVFEANTTGTMSQSLSLTSDAVKAEAYDDNLDVMNVEMSFRNAEQIGGVTLMQNVPNPFVSHTTIQFVMPEAQKATLKVFDITGKTVFTKQGDFTKGNNQIVLTSDQLGAAGVLYYQLETNGFTSTKKMIMMNK